MSEVESLLAERKALEKDFKKFGDKLNEWSHDLLLNRIDMIDSMLEFEGYYA
jgi:hypothetical protein